LPGSCVREEAIHGGATVQGCDAGHFVRPGRCRRRWEYPILRCLCDVDESFGGLVGDQGLVATACGLFRAGNADLVVLTRRSLAHESR
jgi:hypothetical protein